MCAVSSYVQYMPQMPMTYCLKHTHEGAFMRLTEVWGDSVVELEQEETRSMQREYGAEPDYDRPTLRELMQEEME